MKKPMTVLMILLSILSTSAIVAMPKTGGASETPLDVAEKAAAYVISQAIPECGGYKWPTPLPGGVTYDRPAQVAEIGIFLLESYNQTGNALYLEYAEGAARWLICKAVPASGGYKWAQPDPDIPSPGWWLSPCVSQIGEFLLQTYQVTQDTTYLDYAEGAARWLVAMTYYGEPGCFVPYNPGCGSPYGCQAAHGISPGRETRAATFLLHLYQETGNTDCQTIVECTAEWLILGPDKIAESGGFKWRHNRPYGTSFPMTEMSRIALFFYEIYQAFGNAEYLEHANGAITWVLSQAVVVDDTAKWPDNQGGSYYPILPFTGPWAGVDTQACTLLLVAHSVTGDATYLEHAKKHANWVISPAIANPEGGGYKFPYGEGSSYYDAYQNARVYNFLCWMYDATGETLYSEYANGALTWIVYNAEETDGGYKWRTLTYSPYYAALFSPGAAGVGYYLATAVCVGPLQAAVNIEPDTLNVRSQGQWITAYIELPAAYDVNEIDVSSILLNGSISVDPEAPTEEGDYDGDSIPDLMVKFQRATVKELLGTVDYGEDTGKSVEVTLEITGEAAGTPFEGVDTIRVLLKG